MHSIDRCISKRHDATTLVDLLRANASINGEKRAFSFLRDQSGEEIGVTYRELHERAMAIGAELQSRMPRGERAMLLYPPGLDFIAAFFGCMYAGVVAVPVALPARNRSTASVEAIIQASTSSLILSTGDHCRLALESYTHVPTLLNQPWIASDQIDSNRQAAWTHPEIDGRHTAFLQYTSGSTSSPKGVILSHENVLRNAALIHDAFGNSPESSAVFWLPLYHDMGLIGGVVQPIFCGGSCTLMSPAAFLQRPRLWLETISRTGASVSGGPDFAYDLCVRKVRPEERADLDLSNWKVAFTGAERVRAETIERFANAFASCGFRRESFFPCYGLAEATLMVSGGPRQTPPSIVHVRADALGQNRVRDAAANETAKRTLVGCGECLPDQEIVIADQETLVRCADGEVGEIWVKGPSVASGYFDQPDATETSFTGHLRTGEGPFLRTGDLGFLRNGQLFVAGRLKDLIIIHGRNYYPEDIEHTVQGAHSAFRRGYSAAFTVDLDDRERLVIVQEIEPRQRDVDGKTALRAVRRAVATHHELRPDVVVLVKAGEISKTSSGKTQRSTCRDRYLGEQLQIIALWQDQGEAAEDEDWNVDSASPPRTVNVAEAEEWLIERIAARLGLPAMQVHVTTPFLEFGMSSMDAVEIAAEMERWLGRRMSPTAVYNYPNIAALACWLANPSPASESVVSLPEARTSLQEIRPEQLLNDVQHMTEEDMKAFILQEMAKQ